MIGEKTEQRRNGTSGGASPARIQTLVGELALLTIQFEAWIGGPGRFHSLAGEIAGLRQAAMALELKARRLGPVFASKTEGASWMLAEIEERVRRLRAAIPRPVH
jgi:hypothetical protein